MSLFLLKSLKGQYLHLVLQTPVINNTDFLPLTQCLHPSGIPLSEYEENLVFFISIKLRRCIKNYLSFLRIFSGALINALLMLFFEELLLTYPTISNLKIVFLSGKYPDIFRGLYCIGFNSFTFLKPHYDMYMERVFHILSIIFTCTRASRNYRSIIFI